MRHIIEDVQMDVTWSLAGELRHKAAILVSDFILSLVVEGFWKLNRLFEIQNASGIDCSVYCWVIVGFGIFFGSINPYTFERPRLGLSKQQIVHLSLHVFIFS